MEGLRSTESMCPPPVELDPVFHQTFT
jgi:hypothetical protein